MGLIDPMLRHELTGPWAGFGFQTGHFWTPVGSALLDDPATHSLCSVNADKRAYSLGIAYMDAWISGPRTQACMHLPAH